MARRGLPAVGGAGAACVGYGAVVSATAPFTAGADTAVALALGVVAVALGLRLAAGPVTGPVLVPPAPAPGAPARRAVAVWGPVLGAALALELFSYAHGDRAAYPTLSSLLDSLDGGRAGKTLCATAWLALGWWLVDR